MTFQKETESSAVGGKDGGALDQGDIGTNSDFCSSALRLWGLSIAISSRWPWSLRHSQILSHRRSA